MKRLALTGMIAMAAFGDAGASGGIGCAQTGGPHAVAVDAAVTHGMGGPVFQLDGSVKIADAAVPADLAKAVFEREHLAQYWLDGEELRLLLYREREGSAPHGYTQVTIRAKAEEEGTYAGTALIEVFDTKDSSDGRNWSFESAVACMVE